MEKENIQKEFVTYKIALALKELGFNEPCFGWLSWINGTTAYLFQYKTTNKELIELNNHKNNCAAPLWQQVINWFRENYLIDLLILPQSQSACDPLPLYFMAIESYKNNVFNEVFNSTNTTELLHYDDYYEAREQVILKAIEICKNNL